MKRDPKRAQATRAPDFYHYAREYLHSYLPAAARRSPNTIEAYRISLECFLTYLGQQHHVDRAHVSFDHFDRPHLKGWLTWMSEQQHYAPQDHRAAAVRRQSVPDLQLRRGRHSRRAEPGRQGAPCARRPTQADRVPHRTRDPGRARRLHRAHREIAPEPDAAHPAL